METPPHSTIKSPDSPPRYKAGAATESVKHHVVVDVVLRALLFATGLLGIIIMLTSKQTKMIPIAPGVIVPLAAKFHYLPAFTYYVAALSVTCLYSIVTCVLSVLNLMKQKGCSAGWLFRFVVFDALLLGVMGSATGAAGAVAYIGYKGNSHTRWNRVCNIFNSFCGHVTGSVVLSLLPSLTLLLLVWLSVFVLLKKAVRP